MASTILYPPARSFRMRWASLLLVCASLLAGCTEGSERAWEALPCDTGHDTINSLAPTIPKLRSGHQAAAESLASAFGDEVLDGPMKEDGILRWATTKGWVEIDPDPRGGANPSDQWSYRYILSSNGFSRNPTAD